LIRTAFRAFVDNSGLLVTGAVTALIWANLQPESHELFAHALHFVVNDIGMALFFALAAKEVVEAVEPGGPLHSPRRSAVPLFAALGGMAGPAAIYLGLVAAMDYPELARGWAIPCATDIAFSYLAARLAFGTKHPAIPFLLLLAIADDALGLMILAVFYPSGSLRPIDFVLLLSAAMALAGWLRRRRTKNFWPYLVGPGVISWFAFYRGGLHPALALVPIVPFLPHLPPDPGLFVEEDPPHDTLNAFEHWWRVPVQWILLLFGLVNAGVQFGGFGRGTWIVLASILAGKPLGILSATALSVAAGFHRPDGVTWRDLMVVGVIAGIGFTVALFFATAAFPGGPLLDETKMGALLSIAAAPLGLMLARLLRVARSQTDRRDKSEHADQPDRDAPRRVGG
jgi:NhaA family Na+:H+ antiporter